MTAVDLSISIVSWNNKNLLEKCLNSIFKNNRPFIFEVIVVDNASSDGTADMVEQKFPWVKLIRNKTNEGFTKTNNLAFRQSKGRYFLLLNPDTVVKENSLNFLLEFMDKNSNVAVVAPKLLNSDGTLQKSCVGFPTLGALMMRNIFIEYIWPKNSWSRPYLNLDMDYDEEQAVEQPMGAALLVRREIYENLGGLDENIHLFFDEVDFCYRVKKGGGKIFYLPKAQIIHCRGESIKKWSPFKLSHHWNKSRDYYFRKHFGSVSVFLLRISDLARVFLVIVFVFAIFAAIRIVVRMGSLPAGRQVGCG